MKENHRSLILSRAITIFLLGLVGACLIFLPSIMEHYFLYRQMPMKLYSPLLIFCYVCGVIALAAVVFLLWLLCRIAAGNIFDRKNVALLGWLSICCFLVCIVTAVAVAWYFPCIIIAFAAGFLFLILRVVRNVFAAAAEIKEENDMTI